MKFLSVAALALLGSSLFVSPSSAEQFQTQGADGKAHVAHTRVAPVLMHRAFPPYAGVHVYQRQGGGAGRRGR